MSAPNIVRERQAPIKERFAADPDAGKITIAVESLTEGNDPMRVRIAAEADPSWTFDSSAHPLAGGEGEFPCSGDIFLASLAACQEITLRMVATAMGIELKKADVRVEGDMDFKGTMGTNPETPVGFTAIRILVDIDADAPADRLERLVQRAEKYCVIASTLRTPPSVELKVKSGQ
jgi:uncharacterized OsmC-like protein